MMPTVEQNVKKQFEKEFSASDWRLFKKMADFSFSEAAFLKKSDLTRVPDKIRLLVRNSRKRLFIGVGAELLLKAIYLKNGYCINKPKVRGALRFPFTPAAAAGVPLDKADTYMLGDLVDKLQRIVKVPAVVTDGLRVAKVFRNKEGHFVTSSHKFVPESFQAIEHSLVALYSDVFRERLTVHFSLKPGDKPSWKTAHVT